MASVNKVILIGNLGRDPEVRAIESGDKVCNFSMATTDKWNDKNGQRQERTEWHNIVVWGPQAEACGKYLEKGRSVYVEGSLQTRKWQDKEGADRYTTEVKATRVQFLGSGGDGGSGGSGGGNFTNSTPNGYNSGNQAQNLRPDDNDIPF